MSVGTSNRPTAGEEITFASSGCALAGTFVQVPNPVAAALLIVGSGRTDRNSDVRLPAGQQLRGGITRAAAEALAGVGVSTLRYDKRARVPARNAAAS